eukprot:61105-Rhodomonas_salina.1
MRSMFETCARLTAQGSRSHIVSALPSTSGTTAETVASCASEPRTAATLKCRKRLFGVALLTSSSSEKRSIPSGKWNVSRCPTTAPRFRHKLTLPAHCSCSDSTRSSAWPCAKYTPAPAAHACSQRTVSRAPPTPTSTDSSGISPASFGAYPAPSVSCTSSTCAIPSASAAPSTWMSATDRSERKDALAAAPKNCPRSTCSAASALRASSRAAPEGEKLATPTNMSTACWTPTVPDRSPACWRSSASSNRSRIRRMAPNCPAAPRSVAVDSGMLSKLPNSASGGALRKFDCGGCPGMLYEGCESGSLAHDAKFGGEKAEMER